MFVILNCDVTIQVKTFNEIPWYSRLCQCVVQICIIPPSHLFLLESQMESSIFGCGSIVVGSLHWDLHLFKISSLVFNTTWKAFCIGDPF